MKNSKNLNDHHQATARYFKKLRAIPTVHLFFWLLRFADGLTKYTEAEVRKTGTSLTSLALLQTLLEYPDGISQISIAKKLSRSR